MAEAGEELGYGGGFEVEGDANLLTGQALVGSNPNNYLSVEGAQRPVSG